MIVSMYCYILKYRVIVSLQLTEVHCGHPELNDDRMAGDPVIIIIVEICDLQ